MAAVEQQDASARYFARPKKIPLPTNYRNAIKYVRLAIEEQRNVQELLDQDRHFRAGRTIVGRVLTNWPKIEAVYASLDLAAKEPRLNPWLAKVLISELLFGSGRLVGNSLPVECLQQYQQQVHDAHKELLEKMPAAGHVKGTHRATVRAHQHERAGPGGREAPAGRGAVDAGGGALRRLRCVYRARQNARRRGVHRGLSLSRSAGVPEQCQIVLVAGHAPARSVPAAEQGLPAADLSAQAEQKVRRAGHVRGARPEDDASRLPDEEPGPHLRGGAQRAAIPDAVPVRQRVRRDQDDPQRLSRPDRRAAAGRRVRPGRSELLRVGHAAAPDRAGTGRSGAAVQARRPAVQAGVARDERVPGRAPHRLLNLLSARGGERAGGAGRAAAQRPLSAAGRAQGARQGVAERRLARLPGRRRALPVREDGRRSDDRHVRRRVRTVPGGGAERGVSGAREAEGKLRADALVQRQGGKGAGRGKGQTPTHVSDK
uniref:Uncharacterized protein n=1 Tax=Anopheles arabiensis TaxID=7173 RepID=A0A8W7MTJ5_ANOAR